MRTRVTIALLMLLAALLACNLTTTPPTPTAQPQQPTSTGLLAPTLFASITPLVIPGGGVATIAPPANCPPPPGWIQYQVEAGDSLSALAQATGVTLQDVANANCLADPNTLYTGQIIYLPRSPNSG